jgi:hemoglobin-like flavoprotein
MVLQAILAVVEHMDDAAWLRGTLRPLGAKHLAYGVTEPMYPMVAEALLATLARASGSSWDVEIEGAWTRAITAVAGEMIAGARLVELSDSGPTTQPSPDSPPPPSA